MQTKTRGVIQLCLLFCTISSIVGCQTNALANAYVPSFKQTYPNLLIPAQRWHPDIELVEVSVLIFLETRFPYSLVMSSDFQAPSHPVNRFITIRMQRDGTIIIPMSTLPRPTAEKVSIDINDVRIDSVDAWQIFIQEPEVLAYREELESGAILRLMYNSDGEDNTLVWRLITGGTTTPTPDFYIDASSGEFLGTLE